MRLRLAILIAGLTSFISVSMEIMWIEIISYISRGHAGIFGAVLGLVLLGMEERRISWIVPVESRSDISRSISFSKCSLSGSE